MPMLLTTAGVAGVTGATVRMISHWTSSGLLPPSGQEAAGKGSRRLYSFQDVIVAQAICVLRKGGCPFRKIRGAIKYLREHYPTRSESAALARLLLLTDGNDVYLLTDEREVVEVVSRQLQIVWAVPLGRLIIETTQRWDKIPQKWTDRVLIHGRTFHLDVAQVRSGPTGPGWIAHCRELPGTLNLADTADEAVSGLKHVLTQIHVEPKEGCGVRRGAKNATV